MEKKECLLCGQLCERELKWEWYVHLDCPVCGRFALYRPTYEDKILNRMSLPDKMRLSACAREFAIHMPEDQGLHICTREPEENAHIGTYTVDAVLKVLFPQRVQDRFDRALLNLCAMTSFPGETLNIEYRTQYPILMAETVEAYNFIERELRESDLISASSDSFTTRLHVTGRGFGRANELESPLERLKSPQAFVAMWFSKDMSGIYDDGIVPAIRDCGFNPYRIDNKETNKDVTDEIIAEIKRSRFIVSDFTGHRNGVYFEAGFAMGQGIPVIWMCRENDIDNAHFDTRQFSHVLWASPEELRRKLTNRIRALIPGAK